MKYCPRCQKTYDSSWVICLSDSISLIEGPGSGAVDFSQTYKKFKYPAIQSTILFGLFILAIYIFYRIINSEAYIYRSIDEQPIRLITYFIQLPVTIGVVLYGTYLVDQFSKIKRQFMASLCGGMAIFSFAVYAYGKMIYENLRNALP
jgi:hypothetical protein